MKKLYSLDVILLVPNETFFMNKLFPVTTNQKY